jgi:membrane protease YdiL (CAAX protease family)
MPSLPSSASAPGAEAPPPAPEPSRGQDVAPWPAWFAPLGVVLGFAVGSVGTVVVTLAAATGGSSVSHPTPAVSILADIVFDLGFVVSAIYVVSMRGRPRPVDFGFRRVRLRVAVIAFVLAVIGYYGLTAVYSALLHLTGQDKLPSELGVNHSTAALVAAAVFVCVIAPIAEEFFFRGFFFGALRNWGLRLFGRDISPWLAAAITGVLFGLAHTGSASSQYLIPLGFLGFVLCLVRWRTRSLYPCIALHSANNALALGINQLGWSALEITGLVLASWLVITALTAPLGAREPSLA